MRRNDLATPGDDAHVASDWMFQHVAKVLNNRRRALFSIREAIEIVHTKISIVQEATATDGDKTWKLELFGSLH